VVTRSRGSRQRGEERGTGRGDVRSWGVGKEMREAMGQRGG